MLIPINMGPFRHFVQRYRLSKESFEYLCVTLAQNITLRSSQRVTLEKNVLCALLFYANGDYQRVIGVANDYSQEAISRYVQESDLLASSESATERARLLAVFQAESGYWLQALPSANIGTLLDKSTLSLAISLRLGVKTNHPHCCRCGSRVGELGHHGLSCQMSAGRVSCHACINDVIRRALVAVNVPAVLEPNGFFRDDGKRPDGMTLIPWKQGRPLVWDATCVDTLAPCHTGSTSLAAGAAAASAECSKRRKYSALIENYIFVPFGVETMGPWGPSARSLFKELSKMLTELTGDQKTGSYLGQRISLAIKRGNAASLLGTIPDGGAGGDMFFIL
ncbi:hypothetical protein evm_010068 [Chilo suppressalis]|nr:hypothetical protein evm_010068 [Chilo suppressalis]